MTADRPPQVLLAATWMVGAIFCFSAMALAGRAAAVELDTFEIMAYRSMIGLAVVLAVAGAAGTLNQISTSHMGLHFFRNVAHFTGQNLWFWAVTMIPLAQLFALEFTSPLWVMVLAAIFLGERLTAVKLVAGALGFLGILILVRPGLVTISPGMIAAGLSAIGFAVTAIFTKRLTQSVSITCILFWLTAMQIGLGLICALYDGDMALPSAASLPFVVVIALCGLGAHFCLTTALSLAPASVVMPIDFVRLPAIALVGMVFYDEALEWPVLVGAAMILLANAINIRGAQRPAAPQPERL